MLETRRIRERGANDKIRWLIVVGNQTCDRRLSVENSQTLPSAHGAQMFAQVTFQIGNPNLIHSHIIVIYGHVWQVD